jgi:hypothetical protein
VARGIRSTACAALLVLALSPLAAATASQDTRGQVAVAAAAAAPLLSPQAYLNAVTRDIAPLKAFGRHLLSVTSNAAATAQAGPLRRDLRHFAAGLSHLAGFRVSPPVLDAQRRRIVIAGRATLPVLGRFVDAIGGGDQRGAKALLPAVQRSLDQFGKAALV